MEFSNTYVISTKKFPCKCNNFNSMLQFHEIFHIKKLSYFFSGYVIISGDYDGEIKVFLNAVKPKHSSLP